MNIVSLFNGHSGGNISFDEAGIKYKNYYSSEVDKHCLKMEKHLFPDNIQMGDVRNVYYKDGYLHTDNGIFYVGSVGALIGGSPCQSFSFAGKRNGMTTLENIEIVTLEQYLILKAENFEFDGYSYLFWEYMRILKELRVDNPDVFFMLENVKMEKGWNIVINDATGVEPVLINSALVSAQNRNRLYWTNIPGSELTLFGNRISQPKDKNILLKDIIETGLVDRDKSFCLDANYYKGGDLKNYLTKKRRQLVFEKIGIAKNNKEIFVSNKSSPPCAFYETRTEKGKKYRKEQRIKTGKDTTLRDKESKMYLSNPHEKANCLVTVDSFLNYIIDENFYIRKLTPVECARLQTIPEPVILKMLSSGVSNSQIYKQIGNGWTIQVIAHILKGIAPQ